MKKILSLLIGLLTLPALAARVSESVTFDFRSPNTLPFSQAVDIPTDNAGDLVNITRNTLVSDPVTISFSYGQGNNGVAINAYTNAAMAGEYLYALAIRPKADMTVTVGGGCELSKIEFLNNSALSNLTLISGAAGSLDRTSKVWNATEEGTTTTTFTMGSTDKALIYTMRVVYTRPSVPLTLETTIPEEMSAFESVDLMFNTEVTEILNSDGATLTGTDETPLPLTMMASGTMLTVSSETAVTAYGDYTLVIAAGALQNEEGSVNDEIRLTFRIEPVRTTLTYQTVSPAEGTYTFIPKDIVLSFERDVALPAEPLKGKMYKNGEALYAVTLTSPVDGDKAKVMLTNSHEADITEGGTWRIVIPEGAIHNALIGDVAEDRWNAEFALTYTVHSEVEEQKAVANELLAKIGLGFPAEESDGRKGLADAVADAAVTAETLQGAIQAFLNETDVTLPAVGQWYQIAGVNNAGEKIFLTVEADGEKVGISKDATQAGAFKVSSVTDDGKVVFETKNGKFLHVLTTLPLYDKTSSKNLTDTQSEVNELTLAKFTALEGTDANDFLGLFTINGSLGKKDGAEESSSAYALLSYAGEGTISTDPSIGLRFNERLSSAFVLMATDEPGDTPPPGPQSNTPGYALNAKTVVVGNPLTLVLSKVESATLADGSGVYFQDADKNKVDFTEPILSAVEGESCQFEVNTTGLTVGSYTLVIPIGTFTYAPATVEDVVMMLDFTLTEEEIPVEDDFIYTYDEYSVVSRLARMDYAFIKDNDLNELVIAKSYRYDDMIPDPTVQVKILNATAFTEESPLGVGHFEVYTDFAKDYPQYANEFSKAIHLVMDEPVEEGSLVNAPGDYCYIIPAAAFGDSNFGKYIDPTVTDKPAKHDCIVNPKIVNITFTVDNDKADMYYSHKIGDIDGDGYVDTTDVKRLMDYILGNTAGINPTYADLNLDGAINVADVIMLINILP